MFDVASARRSRAVDRLHLTWPSTTVRHSMRPRCSSSARSCLATDDLHVDMIFFPDSAVRAR
eukprot:6120545-Prymnesium_polylepis.1